ncbi:MAG: 4'-phosphopantetheinyl transferase family protein [Flavobacteriaceae bacterium]
MPLYKTIHISADVVLHIWNITESEEELQKNVMLTDLCDKRVKGMKSELHRKGFLSIRHLMHLEGYKDRDLYYDDLGKPHLHDGNHISISHSFEFTGIIISRKQRVGIDIEKQREKIIKIAHKFTTLPIQDGKWEREVLVRKLTKLWGAKESLYKISAIQGLSFLQNIFIETEFDHKKWFAGEINVDEVYSEFKISHLEFEGFTCVYALKE